MDRELISKIVGELYINNYILSKKNEAQNDEIEKLRALLEQLDNGKCNKS